MWGVRDHRTVEECGDAVLGGREAIPLMLWRFRAAGIRATRATVRLFFARNRTGMLDHAPAVRPADENGSLSPIVAIETGLMGEDRQAASLHFGALLLDRTEGQEVAAHTSTHYDCQAQGTDVATVKVEVSSAVAIASEAGHCLQSVVFAPNQTSEAFVAAGAGLGMTTVFGDATDWLYRARSGGETTVPFWLARFVDGALPIGPRRPCIPNAKTRHAMFLRRGS